MKLKKVYGVGINDSKEAVYKYEKGVIVWVCPYYSRWMNMLKRCYSKIFHKKHPSYIGCTVCEEWLLFSNFRSWLELQDWFDKELDKDLLIKGNKVYSPSTCILISSQVNTFLNERFVDRGEYPIGVSFHKASGKFQAQCRVNGKSLGLGLYKNPDDAHKAWLKKKREIAQAYATKETNQIVIDALLSRY